MEYSKKQDKKLSQQNPKHSESHVVGENVEKTVIFQKRVTVQTRLPKHTTINLKNRSTRERKAILFMKLLWDHGYRKEIPNETMNNYVEQFLGGFRTTKQAYLGHVKIVGSKGNKRAVRKKGLFEKRRWAYFNPYRQTWMLQHQNVPLPYHYREELVPPSPSPLPNKDECVSMSANMEKISLSHSPREEGLGETVLEVSPNISCKINNNKIGVRERNFEFSEILAESESIPKLTSRELAVFMATPCEEPNRAKIKWPKLEPEVVFEEDC